LPTGTILYLAHGSPAPSGFTFIGTNRIRVVPPRSAQHDHDGDDDDAVVVKLDVYRKN
jgi:hypothetical protein